ncbi:MAG TPA: ABC transporter permease [Candidatus Hydrogenedentes bacterium]|nr:ABC transporter permease [Candidatus Hydrogenedentota bacterium]HRK33842.1 ABC transporter permease [Candidatus Hydrogenedentota bacterium]
MKAYLIRRLLLIIPSFIGISLITFLMLQLMPGNPVMLRLQKLQGTMGAGSISPAIIEETKRLYGLDKPIYVQYGLWVGRMCMLDFGTSYKDRRPVRDKILEALPVTLQLSVASIFLIYLFSIPIGVYSATHQRTVSDGIITAFLFLLYSLPSFWVAMLLIYFLGSGQPFSWFPIYGVRSLDADSMTWFEAVKDRLWHMVLPVFCLTYAGLAQLSQFSRSGMIDVIRQDYIRTARAYGFTERVVIFKYAMRNALIPIITLLANVLPAMIGGSVIIENIFSIPGMGRLSFESLLARDYPMVMGLLTVSALLTLAGLILSDILYAITDPRIKFE